MSHRVPFLFSLLVSSAAVASPVYPEPRSIRETGGSVIISSSAKIIGADAADPDAVRLLRDRLAKCPATGDIREIVIGERGEPAVAGLDDGISAKSGSYRIRLANGRLVIVGADARGTFYAMQTLRQLLGADANPAGMPVVEIDDAPDIAFRGVVEGFYGTPWTQEDRLSQFAFYGRHKLDTYIYGPKDDPFHSSPNWRKPYPDAEAVRIRELVTTERANKVAFVWAIHAGKEIGWIPADYEAVKAKFESMYGLGVRSFAVFFDDIGGEGTNPEKQADLLNWLEREFVKKKPDVTPLVMCPTEYNRGWANPKKGGYLDILGEKLSPTIHVMWTGNSVVSDIGKPGLEWVNARLHRNAYIWWNFPVSDFVRDHLLMGPAYGNAPDIGDLMSGFVSNPMERAEASKVALYGVAGYAWNLRAYDPDAAWEAAMREVMPGASAAFRTFCEHNSDLGANGHGYRRKESVAIAPAAARASEALRDGRSDEASLDAMAAEFAKVTAAPAAIRAGAADPRMIEQISPWLDAFEQLGLAGTNAIRSLRATGRNEAWVAWAKAADSLSRLRAVGEKNNRNPYQPGVKTGSLVLTPFVTGAMRAASARLLAGASGVPVAIVRPESNSRSTETLSRMCDGDPKTWFYSEQNQRVGDWFGLDLGTGLPVSRVSILMGRNDGDHDIVHRGQLEYSPDGRYWKPLGGLTAGERVSWSGDAVSAKKIRYRVAHAGKLDGTKNNVWCAIREFAVNPPAEPARVIGDLPAVVALPVNFDGAAYVVSPQLEVVKLGSGKSVGVELPESVALKSVQADLQTPASALTIESSADGRIWTEAPVTVSGTASTTGALPPVRFVRVRNAGKSPLDIRLAAFRLTPVGGSAPAVTPWTDGDLSTGAPLGAKTEIAVPAGAREVSLFFDPETVGNVRIFTSIRGSAPLEAAGGALKSIVPGSPLERSDKLVITTDAPGRAILREIVFNRAK